MTNNKKRNLKPDSGPVTKRFKVFDSSLGDPRPSTRSARQANTLMRPGAKPTHTLERFGPPHMSPGTPQQPNIDAPPASVSSTLPTDEHSAKRGRWAELRALAHVLSKGFHSFGPLKQAVEGMVAGIETFESAAQNRADYENLRNDLNGLFHDLAEFFDASIPPIMAPSIINFAQGIDRELEIVRLRLSETRIGTYQTDADKILEHYRRIQALLQRLTSNVGFKNLRITDEQATESRLKSLPHSPAAKYNSAESSDLRVRCTQHTRVHVLEGLHEWACNDKSQKIYWLNGMAGTGKTTIAYSFCERLERSKKLAASFFCSRQLPACRDVNRIIPTISYQLSRFSRPFRFNISQVIEEDPDVHNQVLLDQFKTLILKPLRQAKDTLPIDLVVVIDALDECENSDGVDRILNALLSCAQELPVKFFVASRPDAKILDRMRGQHGESISTELRLHELDRPTVQEDIKTYLTMRLISYMNLSVGNLDVLVKRSGVLFIYASTVVRYLESDNFSRADDRLKEILSVSKGSSDDMQKDINDLYATILKGAFKSSLLTSQDRDEIKLVLDTVICSKEPLSIDVMAGILGLGTRKVRAALRSLLSVLHLSDTAYTITTLHESFQDYLLDGTRSKSFHCDASRHNTRLARLCFEQIRVPNPPFNICNLESSYMLDKDVRDLPARVEKAISKQLLYACRYWAAHYMLAAGSQDLGSMLREFASERFLLWMEVVNLSGCLQECVKALYSMRRWSMSADCLDEDVREFLWDICEFATSFSSTPAMLSTPHLYVSTLTFWRDQSPITKHYSQPRIRLITEQSTAMNARASAPLAILQQEEEVRSVAYSPDSAYIVSGSEHGAVRIWDAYSGQPVGQPMKGHTSSITSVAYSPDGAYVISSSLDRSIRIWNAHTSQPIGQPLEGHTDFVTSVAYSPDGAYIVSGSWDRTIRIWDAHTGRPVGQPLEGHTQLVTSVAYSPDGAYIASGSYDYTIRIWDAHTAQPVNQPLKGHNHSVHSVAYSPDGAYIVSGSVDKTIRIWNAHTGQPVGQPMQGHTNAVYFVAYSPDGAYIVSGSGDGTTRRWDAHTSQPVGQPLEGYYGCNIFVAYSPDGAYIVSSAKDRRDAICIWNARTIQSVEQPLEGHLSYVTSVAYSPDGAYIASGSYDDTIRIWDAHTGQPVGQPLKGHTDWVMSLAYSPDGAYIVSGAGDKTIRVWNAHTRLPVGQPLQGHFDNVYSAVYSPNGEYIVSGSYDRTIRIWDTQTGQPVGQLSDVDFITCLLENTHIVPDSRKKTIRIRDSRPGQPVKQPLEGHTSSVTSVAYSPNGPYIVSGSQDNTIRIWDAHTGQLVGLPLEGHTNFVNSVAYSPDGAYVASGSDDRALRIWEARTGQSVGQPLKGHTAGVTSVVYSPDGAYIVSGSDDKTIRIWDAHTGQPIAQPLRGHMDTITSIALSPDGTCVISGSDDRTIRIWDTHFLTESLGVLQPHNVKSQTAAHPSYVIPKVAPPKQHVPCNLGCQIDCPHMAWTLDKDGWIVFRNDKLIWVPLDLRMTLMSPQNTTVICKRGCLQLDLDRNKLGENWHEYFQPGRSND